MKQYEIYAIAAFDDNYIWVIADGKNAVIIDPGCSQEVLEFLSRRQLVASAILVTHHHHDHTGGVQEILKTYPRCELYTHKKHGFHQSANTYFVDEGDEFRVLQLTFTVWQTAGHTDSHISYLVDIDDKIRVFCGDTLFSAGCGRVFTGTIDQLFASIERFGALPDEVMFYPAHEYTLSNLKFSKLMAADVFVDDINDAINYTKQCLAQNKPSLPVCLAYERKINVFLQACDRDLADKVATKHHLGKYSPKQVFAWLRQQKDNF